MQSEIEAHIDYVTKEYLPQMKYTQFNKLKALKMKKYYKKEATLQEHVSNNLWPSILRKRALNQHQVLAEETARIRQQELIDFIK
uniref:Uncharacterized protein n=1 Tax=Romanomermis culicivorax TaxID=13658 RepID=A0A915IEF9_ROMCU